MSLKFRPQAMVGACGFCATIAIIVASIVVDDWFVAKRTNQWQEYQFTLFSILQSATVEEYYNIIGNHMWWRRDEISYQDGVVVISRYFENNYWTRKLKSRCVPSFKFNTSADVSPAYFDFRKTMISWTASVCSDFRAQTQPGTVCQDLTKRAAAAGNSDPQATWEPAAACEVALAALILQSLAVFSAAAAAFLCARPARHVVQLKWIAAHGMMITTFCGTATMTYLATVALSYPSTHLGGQAIRDSIQLMEVPNTATSSAYVGSGFRLAAAAAAAGMVATAIVLYADHRIPPTTGIPGIPFADITFIPMEATTMPPTMDPPPLCITGVPIANSDSDPARGPHRQHRPTAPPASLAPPPPDPRELAAAAAEAAAAAAAAADLSVVPPAAAAAAAELFPERPGPTVPGYAGRWPPRAEIGGGGGGGGGGGAGLG